jgi:hypothetical protein
MYWMAPTETSTANSTLEKRLSDAADCFRADSGLKPQEHSEGRPLGSVLGLIILRFAEDRFAARRAKLESPLPFGGERAGVRTAQYPCPSVVSGAKYDGYSGDAASQFSIDGVEKSDETGCGCRMGFGRPVFGMVGFRAGFRAGHSTLAKIALRLAAVNCTTGFPEAR